MDTDLVSFDKLRARVLEHGLKDMYLGSDGTCVTFILNDGEVFNLYTTEEEVEYARCNDWAYVQSELRVMQQVEP
jgi:hypothetical protein